MRSEAASFIGNIPDVYDRGLGPVIFSDFAADIARRATDYNPSRVLELAAGTGIASRRLRDALPTGAHLTVSDISPDMLDVARAKFRPGERVEFQPADATALPLPDDAFDLVVCQFGVMFFPDKAKSCREVHRVLARGGHYLFSVWDSHRYNPFGRIAHESAAAFFPTNPPQFYRLPFGYYMIDPIKDSLIEAGFTNIGAAVVSMAKEIEDAAAFAHALVFGNPLIDEIRVRGSASPDRIAEALTSALRREFGTEPSRMPLQAIVFSARRA